MIEVFPQNWELVRFFESEPALFEPDQPWLSNKLTFRYKGNGETLQAVIRPSYGDFRFTHYSGEEVVSDIDLHWVQECRCYAEQGKEYLSLRFRKEARMQEAMVYTKPRISIRAGNILFQ